MHVCVFVTWHIFEGCTLEEYCFKVLIILQDIPMEVQGDANHAADMAAMIGR